MTDHVHNFEAFSPGRRTCSCGARLAVEVDSPVMRARVLRGSDVAWANEIQRHNDVTLDANPELMRERGTS